MLKGRTMRFCYCAAVLTCIACSDSVSEPQLDPLTAVPLVTSVELTWTSTGDYIGENRSERFTMTDGNWTITQAPPPNRAAWVELELQGRISVFLAAPAGQVLTTRTYLDAIRYPFHQPPFSTEGHPGLSITADSRGCNRVAGQFVIRELRLRQGLVGRIHATFTQVCDGIGELKGEIRMSVTWS